MKQILLSIIIGIIASPAFAADPGWRPVYDLVMRWLNFIILAFIIIKFGKAPIVNFFKGEKQKTEQQLKDLEKEKEEAARQVNETEKALQDSDKRYEELTRKIIEQGKRKRSQIIENARLESKAILDDAKQKIESHILEETDKFRGELIDSAFKIAMKKLKTEITDKDKQKIIANYSSGIL